MPCPLCQRDGPERMMERHHLKTRRVDTFAVERIRQACHKTVPALFTNTELRDPSRGLDTVAGILANERFARAVAWIATRQPGSSRLLKNPPFASWTASSGTVFPRRSRASARSFLRIRPDAGLTVSNDAAPGCSVRRVQQPASGLPVAWQPGANECGERTLAEGA